MIAAMVGGENRWNHGSDRGGMALPDTCGRRCELGVERCFGVSRWLGRIAWVDRTSGNRSGEPRAMVMLTDVTSGGRVPENRSEIITVQRLQEHGIEPVEKGAWMDWVCGQVCEISPHGPLPAHMQAQETVAPPIRYGTNS